MLSILPDKLSGRNKYTDSSYPKIGIEMKVVRKYSLKRIYGLFLILVSIFFAMMEKRLTPCNLDQTSPVGIVVSWRVGIEIFVLSIPFAGGR